MLRDLQLVDVCFSRVTLNAELTPAITDLRMQNVCLMFLPESRPHVKAQVPDDCELTVQLPKLQNVSVHFWSGKPKPKDRNSRCHQ